MKRHSMGRPPDGAMDVLALTTRDTWIADDGRPHLAFSFRDARWVPYAMSARCQCFLGEQSCPMNLATRKTADRWNCSNGARFT